MPIYKQSGKKLQAIKEKKVELEKTVQNLVEVNLADVFGLRFICSEYPLNNLRIDTLAFDEEQKSFVVIEYKRDRSFSVIDQGYAYLALLLNNKADFVLNYNEKCKKNLRKDHIDWSQSKVIFIASAFTKYQQEAMGFKDLPIELWEVRQYDENLILFNELRVSEKSESIKTVAKGKDVDTVSTQIKQYSIDDHIKQGWTEAREIFEELTSQVQQIDATFEAKAVRSHISFRISQSNNVVFNVNPGKTRTRIGLLRTEPKDVNDPEHRVKYVVNSFKYWNQHVSVIDIMDVNDVGYAVMLIKQVYKRFVQ